MNYEDGGNRVEGRFTWNYRHGKAGSRPTFSYTSLCNELVQHQCYATVTVVELDIQVYPEVSP